MGSDKEAEDEVWAVEIVESLGAKGNEELLSLAVADGAKEKGKNISFKLVNVTSLVPCGMGSSLPQSQADKRVIKGHEIRMFKLLVVPLLETSAAKKASPKYIPARNDKREDGLVNVAHKIKARRFYIPIRRNSTSLVEELALVMPGGCTVVGVAGSKKVVQLKAEKVDVFDSRDDVKDDDSVGSSRRSDGIECYDDSTPPSSAEFPTSFLNRAPSMRPNATLRPSSSLPASCSGSGDSSPGQDVALNRSLDHFGSLKLDRTGGMSFSGPLNLSTFPGISDGPFKATDSGYSPITRLAILEGDEGNAVSSGAVSSSFALQGSGSMSDASDCIEVFDSRSGSCELPLERKRAPAQAGPRERESRKAASSAKSKGGGQKGHKKTRSMDLGPHTRHDDAGRHSKTLTPLADFSSEGAPEQHKSPQRPTKDTPGIPRKDSKNPLRRSHTLSWGQEEVARGVHRLKHGVPRSKSRLDEDGGAEKSLLGLRLPFAGIPRAMSLGHHTYRGEGAPKEEKAPQRGRGGLGTPTRLEASVRQHL